ncbi:DUF2059 domain-containing protein [Luteolibacter sp. GHJ8]|uniref:DUF2059 domain-containing protein n=1 Tax=Luteolibacter rhizosphaerae TaxID=2989719 RepID=A0ABT3G4Q0_9BACT|nr:DUF2059 domain-containing protein [Luteolibacter rhizosphaerae]MCW1914839.1 DUF2059 domain-containing protein [Luteolibacter rhizosphaerae]
MKKLLSLALALACGVLHAADPAPKSPTDELLELMDYENSSVETAMSTFDGFIDQMKANGVPAAAIGDIRKEARKMYVRIFSSPDVRKKFVELYDKHFTADEIVELTEFYRTPLGKKTLAAMPSIMTDAMKVAMPAVEKEMPAFQQKVGEIVEKHQAPAEEEPEAEDE